MFFAATGNRGMGRDLRIPIIADIQVLMTDFPEGRKR